MFLVFVSAINVLNLQMLLYKFCCSVLTSNLFYSFNFITYEYILYEIIYLLKYEIRRYKLPPLLIVKTAVYTFPIKAPKQKESNEKQAHHFLANRVYFPPIKPTRK